MEKQKKKRTRGGMEKHTNVQMKDTHFPCTGGDEHFFHSRVVQTFLQPEGGHIFAPGGINIYAGDAVVNGKEERHKWEQSKNKNI